MPISTRKLAVQRMYDNYYLYMLYFPRFYEGNALFTELQIWIIKSVNKFRCKMNSVKNVLSCHVSSVHMPNTKPCLSNNIWQPTQPTIFLFLDVMVFSEKAEVQLFSCSISIHLFDWQWTPSMLLSNENYVVWNGWVILPWNHGYSNISYPVWLLRRSIYYVILWIALFIQKTVHFLVQFLDIIALAHYFSLWTRSWLMQCKALVVILLRTAPASNGALWEFG